MDKLKKVLVFRTDRFGDFIITNIAINSLQENLNAQIDIVCSKKNFKYIKKFSNFNQIYIFDGSYLKFFFNNFKILKKKYDFIIIYDGKKRSHVISFFLRGAKLSLVKSLTLYKIAKFIGYKVYINSENFSQLSNFNFLNLLINVKPKNIDFYKNFTFDKTLTFVNDYKNSNVFHLDEKWFRGYYYDDFDYFDINIIFFTKLLNIYNKKTKSKLVISTGNIKINFIEFLKKNEFYKINNNEYVHKKYSNIYLLTETTFTQFEYFLKNNCKTLIACEGGVTHISNNLAIKTYAFFQDGRQKFYKHWTEHMKNLKLIKRPIKSEDMLNFFLNLDL